MPFLTWCPDCCNDLRDVGWKTCDECGDEFCLDCYPDHVRYEHDQEVDKSSLEPDDE